MIQQKKRVAIAACLIFAAIIWIVIYNFQSDSTESPTAPVVVWTATTQPVSDRVEALGNAEANESIAVTSTVSDRIEEILFEDGQTVKAGDILVRLEQHAEQAALAAERDQLAEHERELNRLNTLVKQRAAAQRDLDIRRTQRDITQKRIEGAQAEIEDRTLRAPFDGTVGVRRLSVGALVEPGDAITRLVDSDPIKLDFSVPSIFVSQLRSGLTVKATSEALPDAHFEGTVETVDNRIDPVSRSVLVRALIPNPNGDIKPGLLMQVVLLENTRDALMIPEESVIQRGEDHFIFRLEETADEDGKSLSKVIQQKVAVGLRKPGLVEITEGIAAGDVIVVRGMGEVRDGQAVTVNDRWSEIRDSQFGSAPSETSGE